MKLQNNLNVSYQAVKQNQQGGLNKKGHNPSLNCQQMDSVSFSGRKSSTAAKIVFYQGV